jgi:Rieske Fe-S protein
MTMTEPSHIGRRTLLLGVFLNGIVGLVLGVPVVRFLLSPLGRGKQHGADPWISLGSIDQFPVGQTRLATYQAPMVSPADGETDHTACWVRRVGETRFQVFAVNCAHLGCPVRWFPQSGLFLCPCHGGAYYADGARASGPPERGLFEYPYRIDGASLLIRAGAMPTPGLSASRRTGASGASGATPCA